MISALMLSLALLSSVPSPDVLAIEANFHFQRTGVAVSDWSIVIYSTSGGGYREGKDEKEVPIHVGETTLVRIMAGRATVVAKNCETKSKHIAQTGRKEITYQDRGSWPSCVFNYSDNAALNDAADAFIGMAETIHIGATLKHEQRYDRLALDAEMDSLVEQVKSGSAIEVQNIAPILQELVDDDRVMERVKRKAAHLLEGAGIPVKNFTP